MRTALLLTAIVSTTAHAYPATYLFSGEVTEFNFVHSGDFPIGVVDPNLPLIGKDGSAIFNGKSSAFGQFTLDAATLPPEHSCDSRDLSYEIATEGATYYAQSGQGCEDSVFANEDVIGWHVEGPRLSYSGGLESTIQNFAFNFANGEFIGGTFGLMYMNGNGYYGYISGIIDRLTEVPEPSSIGLLAAGLVGVVVARRKQAG
ncbi:MAG: hypothetical protein JWM78_1642 [Verrucomicrobiaceae bacterium]|nr:hypothetical protein [Verrucomicrobiaceae bacterium]